MPTRLTPTSWKQEQFNGRWVLYQAVAGPCEFCGVTTDDLYAAQQNDADDGYGAALCISAHYAFTHVPITHLICKPCADKLLALVNCAATHTYGEAVSELLAQRSPA